MPFMLEGNYNGGFKLIKVIIEPTSALRTIKSLFILIVKLLFLN